MISFWAGHVNLIYNNIKSNNSHITYFVGKIGIDIVGAAREAFAINHAREVHNRPPPSFMVSKY
jgi:hypothetical protein